MVDVVGRIQQANVEGVVRGWVPGAISPIILTVDYTDTQFSFKFKAPATSTLRIYDGDGTMTQVAGQDDTIVTHVTSYSAAGTYYFYVLGDVLDITWLQLAQGIISGSIEMWDELINMTSFNIAGSTSLSGDISNWESNDVIESMIFNFSSVIGSYDGWGKYASLESLSIFTTAISGDASQLPGILADDALIVQIMKSASTFDAINDQFPTTITNFVAFACGWTSTMVDNCLISLANSGVNNAVVNIGGTNAPRTSASDAAKATLIANGCTVTVNE